MYTYDDIITAKDIFTGRVKKEDILGVSGWFLDIIPADMSVKVLGIIGHFGILKDIRLDCAGAFREYATGPAWIYFMPEKKKSAPEFKVGDKVRIVKEWDGHEYYSLPTVGKTGEIKEIGEFGSYRVCIPSDDDWWWYKSDALELIEETAEEKKYKPRYTEADIISDPHDPRLEGAIGKVCYVVHHLYYGDVVANANNDDKSHKGILVSLGYDPASPFEVHTEAGLYWKKIIIAKDQPEYVPFDLDNPEVRRELMGKTIINNYGLDGDGEFREVMIVGFMNKSDEDRDCWSSNGDTEGTIAMTVEGYFHANELLKECTFSDGTPCGKLKED